MRHVKIFSGSSHPLLVEAICERLSTSLGTCELKKFSNGETSVNINTSIRGQDVFIVQSGSNKVNDSVMELLIMISACKGGSANSITAVMPYFPYSRQSKKKSHRGAITARLVANLLSVAGVNHIITVDLHAPPTQGFFGKPVDNLHAEPLIAKWIRNNVPGWNEAVVVSKNPGGSKRVTSLADALKLNFGIITTDRRRDTMGGSTMFERNGFLEGIGDAPEGLNETPEGSNGTTSAGLVTQAEALDNEESVLIRRNSPRSRPQTNGVQNTAPTHRQANGQIGSSPLTQLSRIESESPPTSRAPIQRTLTIDDHALVTELEGQPADEYTDERAREVITGRLIQGHIVDDDYPSPILPSMSNSTSALPGDSLGPPQLEDRDLMTSSYISTLSTDHPLGGTFDAGVASDEEEGFRNPELEQTVTLVGNVKDRIVIIIDDLIDQCGSWIAGAETVVKKGGAQKVYCIATHGLFGDDCLELMENCQCIDFIVVTNSYPIASDRVKASKKLIILDLSNLLAEAIKRNHYGESMSQLYQHYQD